MLPRLLQREWILNRLHLLVMLAIFAAYQVYVVKSVDATRPFVVMAALFASFLATTLFVREDKFRSTWSSCALPITRLELIRARYVAAWVMVVAALAAATLLAAVIPGGNVRVGEVFNPSTLLIAAAGTTFVFAWVLPFTIRFGMFGLMVFLILGQVAGAALLVLGRTLGRSREGGGNPIRAGFGAISDAVLAAREALTPGIFAVAVIVLLLVVNWLSYRFTVFMFRRREF